MAQAPRKAPFHRWRAFGPFGVSVHAKDGDASLSLGAADGQAPVAALLGARAQLRAPLGYRGTRTDGGLLFRTAAVLARESLGHQGFGKFVDSALAVLSY